jgi:hypothetical protein
MGTPIRLGTDDRPSFSVWSTQALRRQFPVNLHQAFPSPTQLIEIRLPYTVSEG